jgi:hypothetical protein
MMKVNYIILILFIKILFFLFNYYYKMDSFLNNTNYKFVSPNSQSEYTYNPQSNVFKYYQLCSFKNPYNNKYHIRRFVMNSKNEFVSVNEKYIDAKEYKRFVQSHRLNEYKLHNAYDLNYIAYPSLGEITIIQSPILQTDSDYSGFSKF